MRIKIYLIGLIISTFSISGCEKEKPIEIDTEIFSISYSKGNSWIDYSYKVTFDQNGLMQVSEKNGLSNVNRDKEYHLPDSDLLTIKEKLKTIVRLKFSDRYGFDDENAPTDLPTTKLTYKTTMKSDSTSIYYPKENELPTDLELFLQTVEQVILVNDTLRECNLNSAW